MMSSSTRSLDAYAIEYKNMPFEAIQASYRRKLVLEQIEQLKPTRILEIGCGLNPLFTENRFNCHFTVIEPTIEFVNNACELAKPYQNVQIINGQMESHQFTKGEFDLIVLSCLLHEVSSSILMLNAIHKICTIDTVLHINVPNAYSLHRLLAVAMEIIPSIYSISPLQQKMQQNGKIYDIDSLAQELLEAGFQSIANGGILIKPFTHSQMQTLVDREFLKPNMLYGFDQLAKDIPIISSEIWVNAKIIT